jgi:hypothetical protein
VANVEDVKDHINDDVNVTEIKWDPLGDNILIPYEDFYKFINRRLETIYLLRKNAFLGDVAKNTTNIYIDTLKKKQSKIKSEIMYYSKIISK